MKLLIALFAVVAALVTPAAACGPDTDCTLGDRTYRIALPPVDGPFGALVFMHGYGASSADVMNDAGLRRVAADLGLALVAPKSAGKGWMIRNAPRGRDDDAGELPFFDAMRAEITARYTIDPTRVFAAGFSGGAMMTWTLACRRGDAYRAFIPISGTFWGPLPQDCDNPPVDLMHVHGTSDEVVPLAGRAIADSRQGAVADAFALFSAAGGYGPSAPLAVVPGLACEGSREPGGHRLVLCLHDGGHMYDPEWVRAAITLFTAPASPPDAVPDGAGASPEPAGGSSVGPRADGATAPDADAAQLPDASAAVDPPATEATVSTAATTDAAADPVAPEAAAVVPAAVTTTPPVADGVRSGLASAAFSHVPGPSAGPPLVIGSYARGCLEGASQLPPDGPTWEAMRPARNRHWGHPSLVGFVEDLAGAAPSLGLRGILVGDMSQPRGGPLPSGHTSHQVGLDVDVWFDEMPEQPLTDAERDARPFTSMLTADGKAVDPKRFTVSFARLVETAARDPRTARIFVHPLLKQALCAGAGDDRAWLSRVRPWYGHFEHFHVRLKCPPGKGCVAQPAPPKRDGCGAPLAWWFTPAPYAPKPGAAPKGPLSLADMPLACRALAAAP